MVNMSVLSPVCLPQPLEGAPRSGRTPCLHKSLGLVYGTLVSPLYPCVYSVIYISMDSQTFILCIALETHVTLFCCSNYSSLATGGTFCGQQIPLVICSLWGLNRSPFQTLEDAGSFCITPVQPRNVWSLLLVMEGIKAKIKAWSVEAMIRATLETSEETGLLDSVGNALGGAP